MVIIIHQKQRQRIMLEISSIVDDTQDTYPVNYKGTCGDITILKTGERTTDFKEITQTKKRLNLKDSDFDEELYFLPEPPEGIGCLLIKKL